MEGSTKPENGNYKERKKKSKQEMRTSARCQAIHKEDPNTKNNNLATGQTRLYQSKSLKRQSIQTKTKKGIINFSKAALLGRQLGTLSHRRDIRGVVVSPVTLEHRHKNQGKRKSAGRSRIMQRRSDYRLIVSHSHS